MTDPKRQAASEAWKRRHGEAEPEDTPPPVVPSRPSFPGFRWLADRWPHGRRPPQRDPARSLAVFEPCSRVVDWDGEATDHRTEECRLPHCKKPGEWGRHSEVRPDGFIWEGARFASLPEALENQAFARWYEEEGGRKVVEDAQVVLTPLQYRDDEAPPLPKYNFFLGDHIDEMTAEEIRAYRMNGEVPTRLRRRGRAKGRS